MQRRSWAIIAWDCEFVLKNYLCHCWLRSALPLHHRWTNKGDRHRQKTKKSNRAQSKKGTKTSVLDCLIHLNSICGNGSVVLCWLSLLFLKVVVWIGFGSFHFVGLAKVFAYFPLMKVLASPFSGFVCKCLRIYLVGGELSWDAMSCLLFLWFAICTLQGFVESGLLYEP